MDAVTGLTLTLDLMESTETDALCAWVQEVASPVHAEVLVTDDADGFKTAADSSGLQQQVCKSHVRRNTKAVVADVRAALT